MGEWENVSFDNMLKEQPELLGAMLGDLDDYHASGGEPFTHLKARVQEVLERVIARDENTLLGGAQRPALHTDEHTNGHAGFQRKQALVRAGLLDLLLHRKRRGQTQILQQITPDIRAAF